MMSHHHPRRILTPLASKKRKEREALYAEKPMPPPSPAPVSITTSKAAEPVSCNRLLAGYMAYEFLSRGTLFGKKWDPARAEAVPVSSGSGESKKTKPSQSQRAEAEPTGTVKHQKQPSQQQQRYAEVSSLLKEDGAHVLGIVNPTQLARWIQM